MRLPLLVILIITLSAGMSEAQKEYMNVKRFPFQVIYSSNCFNHNDSLTQKEYIRSRDRIEVRANGKIQLVHYSGFAIELSKKEIYAIDSINKSFGKSLNGLRIPVNMLFSRFPGFSNNCRVSGINFTNYKSQNIKRCPDDSVRIKWEVSIVDTYSNEFRVNIIDVFDDPIESYTTQQNEINLSLSDFSNDVILLKVKSIDNKDVVSSIFGIRINDKFCFQKKNSALEYLIAGLQEENNSNYSVALKYYNLALSNSSEDIREFYKSLVALAEFRINFSSK